MATHIILKAGLPAGAGKTHAASKYACDQAADGRWIIITQPSRDLVEQTYETIVATAGDRDIIIDRYHGDLYAHLRPEDRPSVTGEIRRYLSQAAEDTSGTGRILICTHAAYLLLPWRGDHRASQWHCIMDEVPTIHSLHAITDAGFATEIVDATTHLRSEYFTRVSTEYRCLTIKDSYRKDIAAKRTALIKLQMADEEAGLPRDKDRDQRITVYTHLLSDWFDVFIKAFERPDPNNKIALKLYVLMTPEMVKQFRSYMIMAARIEDTALYHFWGKRELHPEFAFFPATHITRRARYTAHSNGNRLTIFYGAEGPWSKRRAGEETGGMNHKNMLIKAVSDLFDGEDFIWLGNNDTDNNVFGAGAKAKRLSNSPHGLNSYQHYNNVAIISALNLAPDQRTFLTAAGFDENAQRRSIYWHAAYQALMRCSLRDPDATAPVRCVVPGRDMADWLASEVFPGARVEALPTANVIPRRKVAGRPKKEAHEKSRACRDTKVRAALLALHAINHDAVPSVRDHAGNMRSIREIGGTYLSDKRDPGKNLYMDYGNAEAFVRSLHADWEQSVLTDKHDGFLMSPAIFDRNIENDEGKTRGYPNIVALRGIMLDNDGSASGEAVSIEEFAAIFPELRLLIWNSFRSRPDALRWRAYVPTSHLITREAHDLIMDEIKARLLGAGYIGEQEMARRRKDGIPTDGLRVHGFDESKFFATSIFYLPSQHAAHPDHAFWIDHCDGRYEMDVYEWVRSALYRGTRAPRKPSDQQEISLPAYPKGERDGRVAASIAVWRKTTRDYHTAFFGLTCGLVRAGLGDHEIKAILLDQARHSPTPKDRIREIETNMRNAGKLAR